MKLSMYELAYPIEFSEGVINTLVIENSGEFGRTVFGMTEQASNRESKFTLSQGTDILDFSKYAEVITDVFRLSLEAKSITAKINQAVIDEAMILSGKAAEILTKINELASEITGNLDFDSTFTDLNDLNGVLKLLNFSVDFESMDFYERILQYIDFFSKYFGKKLFVIVNLKSCLKEKELIDFAKTVKYKKYNVLLIEDSQRDKISPDENIRIIDKDLCEF